jgi:hypothetical protein
MNEFPTSEFFLCVKIGHNAIVDSHFEEYLLCYRESLQIDRLRLFSQAGNSLLYLRVLYFVETCLCDEFQTSEYFLRVKIGHNAYVFLNASRMRQFGCRQIIFNRNKTYHLDVEKHFPSCIPEVGFQFTVHSQ